MTDLQVVQSETHRYVDSWDVDDSRFSNAIVPAVPLADLVTYFREGLLDSESQLWRPGMSEWSPARLIFPQLSEALQAPLQEFRQARSQITDLVRGVGTYRTGVYLHGRAGVGKTHLVQETLTEHGIRHTVFNSHVTKVGLLELLADYPDHVIVIDDVPNLFKNLDAVQVLLAALGGDVEMPRRVTSSSIRGRSEVLFRGGIVAIANVPLSNDPVTMALTSRVAHRRYSPSDDGLMAFAYEMAMGAYSDTWYRERRDVVDHVISVSVASHTRIELRHIRRGWDYLRQYRDGNSQTHWRDLVTADIQNQ